MDYKRYNIAAVVNDMGPSQKSFYMIKEFNKAAQNVSLSVTAFFNQTALPVTRPLFCCQNIAFFSGYHGHAICTTLSEAEMVLKSNNNSTKYLYLWDMDWLIQPVHFMTAANVMRDERLKIISRSESHSQIIENFCNKSPIAIVDNWNLNQLCEVIYAN